MAVFLEINMARLSFTTIKNQFLRNIGKSSLIGTTATNPQDIQVIEDFKFNLGNRYQLVLSKLQNYMNQDDFTDTTVVGQQNYNYPVGVFMVDDVVVTIGSVQYPLTTIYSQHSWNVLNAIQIQPTAIPQFIFPRKYDYGIWPIPQGTYPITFYGFQRDRDLTIEDYTTGTVTMTAASTTVTGSSTTFIPDMVGRWISVTSEVTGHGYWYRITGYTSPTVLTIGQPYAGLTNSSLAYTIGETPQLPEEAHICLLDGTTADFYSGFRANQAQATWFNNKFWTGDGQNPNREDGSHRIQSGLIGIMNRYADRDNKRIVMRQPRILPANYKIWATSIS